MVKPLYSRDQRRLVQRLKTAREECRMHQKEVAKRLGRSQSYVSKIESGQRRVDVLQLKELARVYKKDLTYFIQ